MFRVGLGFWTILQVLKQKQLGDLHALPDDIGAYGGWIDRTDWIDCMIITHSRVWIIRVRLPSCSWSAEQRK